MRRTGVLESSLQETLLGFTPVGLTTKRIVGRKTKALVHCLYGTPCSIKHTSVDFREMGQKTTNLVQPFHLLHIWEVDLWTE